MIPLNSCVTEWAGALGVGNAVWASGVRRKARMENGYRCLLGIYLPFIRKDRTTKVLAY